MGLKTRDINNPIEKENNTRKKPPIRLYSSIVHPTPRWPAPEKLNIANEANPIPANTTSAVSAFVDIRRINNAYIIFPIYSKNKDQLGPFKGYISPFPRISGPEPGTAGIKKRLISKASITMDMETCVPSHFSHPCIQNAITPKTAPRTTIGCKRINRRLIKSFVVMVFHRSS